MPDNYDDENMEIKDAETPEEEEEVGSEESEQQEQPEKEPKKKETVDKEHVQHLIQERIRKANQKHEKEKAEKEARIRDLEAKLAQYTSGSTGAQPEAGDMGNKAAPGAMTEEQLEALLSKRQKAAEFKTKLEQAVEEDAEFKELAKTGNFIPPELQFEMMHLDNAPAVIKHLLKDKKDYRALEQSVLDSVNKGEKNIFVRFINDLSDKLEKVDTKPGPSKYKPPVDLTDVGEGGEDFDIPEYVQQKKRGK